MENFLKCPGSEQSLSAVPEVADCPHCGAEIEIWSDERKGKCSTCKSIISKEQLAEENHFKKKYTVEIREWKNAPDDSLLFEHFETIISLSAIDYADRNKIACEACEKFGKNFACPPFSPSFQDYTNAHQYAKIICIRLPQEYFRHLIQEEIYRASFKQAREILVNELLVYRKKGFLVGGCGYCQSCERCGAEQGADTCSKPDEMIYSLESMGVNLTDLTKACFDFDLEWSGQDYAADFVCSIGAVFLHKQDIA